MRGLDRARGELDHALVVPRARALGVLARRQAEEQHGRDAERVRDPGLLDGAVDREVVDPGQLGDRRALGACRHHEHRVHEMGYGQLRLADEAAQHAGLTQAAQAGGGKGHLRASLEPAQGEARDGAVGDGQRDQVRVARGASPSSARSVGLNGKAPEMTLSASNSVALTAPEGISARKASGSASSTASSEATRTSRASAPSAVPSAAKASAPAASASGWKSSATKIADDRELQQRDHERRGRGEQDLLGQQRVGRDQPRRRRANTPSSRSSASSAGGQQHGDEHQRQRRRDRDRELVERRLGAADDGLLDPHGLADRVQDRLAQVEVVGGELGEAADLLAARAARARPPAARAARCRSACARCAGRGSRPRRRAGTTACRP